ncbi:MAG TPA: serine/threonine-protein kinase [Gemmatimonadaceae bacterium]
MLQPPQPHKTVETPPLTPPSDPLAPLRAALRGRYDIERELGQGAFATVYLARDLKHERKVAIKVLLADPSSETGELRFIREIRLLARLQHPNILPLHDSGHAESLLYYVMPYVGGETLRSRIDREKQLPSEEACSIARDIADALAYAHGQGVIHRDIKPENILLSAGHPIIADFGIARVIDIAGVMQLTRTGTASPGTPAYMSPEQLMGDKAVDARSDIYSLGCVLFEMLTGKPPFAGKEGFVRRFTEPPPSASRFKPGLPVLVDAAVSRALQRDPKDRYASAKEFAAALSAPAGIPSDPRDAYQQLRLSATILPEYAEERPGTVAPQYVAENPASQLPAEANVVPGAGIDWQHVLRSLRSRKAMIIGAGAAAILLAVLVAAPAARRVISPENPIDTARFVIIPSSSFSIGAASNSEHVNQKLYEAFGSWSGLHLVSDAAVDEAVRIEGGPPASLGDALRTARRLGAGKLVWTRGVSGSSHNIKAELFDVARGASTGRFALLADSSGNEDFARAALQLLAMPNRVALAEDGDGLTTSFDAWTAYNRGHVALSQWNLADAAKRFAEAAAADPTFPVAQLWLAQIEAWTNPGASVDWAARAANALRDPRLNERDQLISRALVTLAEQRYPAACEAYRRLSESKGTDFVGWYGLGECQSLDSLVVPSASSPSSWRFRSSYGAAARAYMRALEIEPRAHSIFSFGRLQQLIPASAAKIRAGRSDRPKSQIFVAYPSLEGTSDTLGFVPYPLSQFASAPVSAIRTHNAALNANTELLTQFTTAWTRQLPNDPAAFAARAEVLEISGDIGGEPFEQTAVMRALRQVRALTHDPQPIFYTVVKEIWLRFKREEFGQARWLADSLLNANSHPTASEAEALLPLAALTGKLDRTVELGRVSPPSLGASDEQLPPQVRYAASELLINAALGVCGDRILNLERQLDEALVRYLPADRAKLARDELTSRPLSLTVHCTGGQSALRISEPRMTLYQVQQAFARGDKKLARSRLDFAAAMASHARPGDKSLDYTFQESWIRVAIGDTAIAIGLLDNVLGALPSFSSDNLKQVGAAAAAAQAMVLRSRLARARGDTKTAHQWARAVSLLWATADPAIRAGADDIWALSGNTQ